MLPRPDSISTNEKEPRRVHESTRGSYGSSKPVILSLRAESARQPSGRRRGGDDLQLFVCSTASACSKPRSAPSRTRGGERQTIGGSSQAQNDDRFWLAAARSGSGQSPLVSARRDEFLRKAASLPRHSEICTLTAAGHPPSTSSDPGRRSGSPFGRARLGGRRSGCPSGRRVHPGR